MVDRDFSPCSTAPVPAVRRTDDFSHLDLPPHPTLLPAPAFFPSSLRGELSSEALRSETEGVLFPRP